MQTKWVRSGPLFSKKWFALIVLFFLIITPLAAAAAWFNWAGGPVSQNGNEKLFVIRPTDSVATIAKNLKKEGLIRDELAFRLLTRFSCEGVSLTNPLSLFKKVAAKDCLGGQIQAGSFKISPTSNLETIAQKLIHGKPLDSWSRIVEGLRVEEIADKLAKQYSFKPEDFLQVAEEGYMFPDTYLFKTDSTAAEAAEKMRATFDLKYTVDLQNEVSQQGLTPAQGVVLASIIQRETGKEEDSHSIASVFLNRLRIGMPLGSDVTVQYALGYDEVGKTWWKKDLVDQDLKINSPYNTRRFAGLPPGPICNPGLAALKAVAEPAVTDYLYFLYDKEGKIHLAKTLQDHNTNKAKYL